MHINVPEQSRSDGVGCGCVSLSEGPPYRAGIGAESILIELDVVMENRLLLDELDTRTVSS
jgi:hypothetical protein